MKVSITPTDKQLAKDPKVAAWVQKAEEKLQANLDALNDDLMTFGSCCCDAKTGERIPPRDMRLPDIELSKYLTLSPADLGINPGTDIQSMIVDPPVIK